jgi:hypothetical protein
VLLYGTEKSFAMKYVGNLRVNSKAQVRPLFRISEVYSPSPAHQA